MLLNISETAVIVLVMDVTGEQVNTRYGAAKGVAQDIRRNALYSWMRETIEMGKKEDIDFLEIMVSVVLQLRDDGLIEL